MSLAVALLCGGEFTRSESPYNKCWSLVDNKPFMLHQLEWLDTQGHTTVVLCRGTEGTLTALRRAAPFLGERFIVIYGDTLLPIDLTEFRRAWFATTCIGATAFYDGADAGVSGCSRLALDAFSRYESDFGACRDHWLARGSWHRWLSPVSWVEVGSPDALEHARMVLA
jgi:hypothetical protein